MLSVEANVIEDTYDYLQKDFGVQPAFFTPNGPQNIINYFWILESEMWTKCGIPQNVSNTM